MNYPLAVVNKNGDTILHVACVKGQLQILLKAHENGQLNWNCTNKNGKTPLHEAAQFGNFDCVQFLLQRTNCDINRLKIADWTALMLASTKNNLEVIKLLVESDAKLDIRNKDGWTAFHIACREGHEEVVKYLLQVDQNLWDTVSNNGRTPLHTAALHGHLEVVSLICSQSEKHIEFEDNCGLTPVMDACKGGFIDICDYLITNYKVDLCHRDKLGRDCLHLTTLVGHHLCAKFLLSTNKECFLDSVDSTGQTALHYCAKTADVRIISILLANSFNRDLMDFNGKTAMGDGYKDSIFPSGNGNCNGETPHGC